MRAIRQVVLGLVASALVVAAVPPALADDGPAVTTHTVPSFDGTPIEATLFLPPGADDDTPVPLVLRTHGWGASRETAAEGGSDLDPAAGTLARLLAEGYAVLTWDSRGFGCSGGQVRIDDPEVEGRDVSALLDWVVDHAPILRDAAGDPVVGMTGPSYAGGIQLAAAAVDDRIDALAPEITWSDLRYSLYGGEVVKQGWIAFLYALGTGTGTALGLDPACGGGPTADAVDPALHRGVTEFLVTGAVSAETLDFFAKSSVASFGRTRPVTVPTLVLQGSVDTLFDLTDGHAIYDHVRAQGVPARFVAWCGGHVACPDSYADADDRAFLDDAIVTWFARHLRGQDVDTGAPVTYRTNEGVWRDLDGFTGTGVLPVAGSATGLPVVPVVDVPDVEATLGLLAGPPTGIPALPITAAKTASPGDPRAATFEVARADDGPLELVGIPDITLTVAGTTVPLSEATAPLGSLLETLPNRQVGEVLVGSAGPLGAILGGVVEGLDGGGGPLAGLDGTVNVFVKLVHRETGEVVNLQEGAVRVPLGDGDPVTVEVPMPGVAYTIPAGDHLDVEVSTASLMHATGRTPALVDVELAGAVPVREVAGEAPAPPRERPGHGGRPDEPGPPPGRPARPGTGATTAGTPTTGAATAGPTAAGAVGPLPATGGGLGLLGLVALAGATAIRRPRGR